MGGLCRGRCRRRFPTLVRAALPTPPPRYPPGIGNRPWPAEPAASLSPGTARGSGERAGRPQERTPRSLQGFLLGWEEDFGVGSCPPRLPRQTGPLTLPLDSSCPFLLGFCLFVCFSLLVELANTRVQVPRAGQGNRWRRRGTVFRLLSLPYTLSGPPGPWKSRGQPDSFRRGLCAAPSPPSGLERASSRVPSRLGPGRQKRGSPGESLGARRGQGRGSAVGWAEGHLAPTFQVRPVCKRGRAGRRRGREDRAQLSGPHLSGSVRLPGRDAAAVREGGAGKVGGPRPQAAPAGPGSRRAPAPPPRRRAASPPPRAPLPPPRCRGNPRSLQARARPPACGSARQRRRLRRRQLWL